MSEIDSRLAAGTLELDRWTLCHVRLMNDSAYPWLLLVPRASGIVEVGDLSPADRSELMEEIAEASAILRRMTDCHRINVAALGNVVPLLHVHVIARFTVDPAWPKPVWGVLPAVPYAPDAVAAFRARYEEARSRTRRGISS